MKRTAFPLIIILFFLSACAPTIYKVKDFSSKTATHKTVAILPADVLIQLRPREMKKTTEEQMRRLEEQTGNNTGQNVHLVFKTE
jgi:hypothetical protein